MIGKEISHYRILEKLGEGGMGVVYKAYDTLKNMTVALKILSSHHTQNEQYLRRFQREASAGKQLDHPNIVKIYEINSVGSQHFICMEFIEGVTLRDMVKEKPLLPVQVLDIGAKVARALEAAHGLGIIHRDIKSENIMLTSKGEVKVMDFGLAKTLDASMLTTEGKILGTLLYMSPQQAIGEELDLRSDIFSLGVVLYELLTTKLPFSGDYEMALIYSILNEEPMNIREINDTVPPALEQVVFKALKKDPEQRYQNDKALLEDLFKVKHYLEKEEGTPGADLELIAEEEIDRLEEKGFFSKLVGREKQIQILRELFKRVLVGEGHTVFICGETGIGKTRLVWELEKYAKTYKVEILKSRCLFRQGISPYQPIVEAIRVYFDVEGKKNDQKLEQFIQNQAPVIAAKLAAIRVFLNISEGKSSFVESQEQFWDAILTLLKKISEKNPIIFYIDDLHWADEETLKLFYYMSRNSTSSRILMIGTYRPEDIQEKIKDKFHPLKEMQHEMIREGYLTVIALKRVTDKNIREIVFSLFGPTDFDESFYRKLYDETEGNPFFVIELLKFLKTEGFIRKINGGYFLHQAFQYRTIPGKIQEIVLKRIERLNQEERELLEIGAVEGELFHSGTLVSCLGINRIQVLKKLQSLEREHHIIHPFEKRYRFDHGKIREILYDAITPELRSEYHLLIGDYLAEEFGLEVQLAANIAHHFLEGEKNQKALPFLVKAGEHAKSVFANEKAVEFFEKALDISVTVIEEMPTPEMIKSKMRIYEGLGDVLALTGKHQKAIKNYLVLQTFLEKLTPKNIELFWKLASVYISTGESAQAMNCLDHADINYKDYINLIQKTKNGKEFLIDNSDQHNLFAILGKIKIARAKIYKASGKYDLAKKEIEQGLAIVADEGNLKEKSQAMNDLGNILFDQGDYGSSLAMYTKSLEMREKIADKKGIAETYNNLAIVYCEQGNYSRAAEMLENSIKIMKEIGFRTGIAGTYLNLGTVYQDSGKLQAALNRAQEGLKISRDIGNKPLVILSLENLGSIHIDLKSFDKARDYLEESLHLIKEINNRIFEPQVRVYYSRVLMELGELPKAKVMAIKAIEAANRFQQKSSQGFAQRNFGLIEFRRIKDETDPKKVDIDEVHHYLLNSVNIFQELKMQHEYGRSCLELAVFYRWRGEQKKWQKYFLIAEQIFEKLHAEGDMEKIKKIKLET